MQNSAYTKLLRGTGLLYIVKKDWGKSLKLKKMSKKKKFGVDWVELRPKICLIS